MMTLSILTLIIKRLFATHTVITLCHCAECRYVECHVLFIFMLNGVMLSIMVLLKIPAIKSGSCLFLPMRQIKVCNIDLQIARTPANSGPAALSVIAVVASEP